MSEHTHGPWRIERQNPSPTTGEWMIAGSRPGYLAEVRDCGSGLQEANAKLIAAAPELLEALDLMVSTATDGGWPTASIVIARAAIVKAIGESGDE